MSKKKPRLWPELPAVLPGRVVDNHTHLPLRAPDFITDGAGVCLSVDEQLARAQTVGVERVISCACEAVDLQVLCDLADGGRSGLVAPGVGPSQGGLWPQVKWALAIHPNEAPRHGGCFEKGLDGLEQHGGSRYDLDLDAALALLQKTIAVLGDKVAAVGETGLDYFRTAPGCREVQKQAFQAHIALAKELDLPMQIHDRDAHDDVVEVLRRSGAPERTVFHCFSGGVELAEICAQNGWYASFAGPLTYPANDELRAAFLAMPPELVLVETDAPYLTPAPWRGMPNASYVMPWTVLEMARLWDIEPELACERLLANTDRVYGAW